jgi:zinc transport system substrate-binding protein
MHSFEPTPEDILKIKNAELFIYIGGESEKWIEEILENNEISSEKTLRLMDLVELKDEEIVEGMEEETSEEVNAEHEEYDEHIWTSPTNMRQLIDGVRMKLTMIDPATSKQYGMNASRYESRFVDIDRKIREIVNSSNKNELVFADRFPFRYFVDEYDIKYYAAFPGCAEQTEASASTIAFLIKKVKEDGIGVVLKTELTSDKLAKTISEETGAKIMTLNAGHNISAEDFRKGVRYADIMEENIEVLKEALK